jgi:hypothetical protein
MRFLKKIQRSLLRIYVAIFRTAIATYISHLGAIEGPAPTPTPTPTPAQLFW